MVNEKSDMSEYVPQPIDTSDVKLSKDLAELMERLAENTHEVWAAGRIADGWKYGETRDDSRKLHPCLVPYADLPDSERDYDRRTAAEALKVVISLGYSITSVDGDAPPG